MGKKERIATDSKWRGKVQKMVYNKIEIPNVKRYEIIIIIIVIYNI